MKILFINLIFLIFLHPQLLCGQPSSPKYFWQVESMLDIDFMGCSGNFMLGQLGFTHRLGPHLIGLQGGVGEEYKLFGGEPESFWHVGLVYSKFKNKKNFHYGCSFGLSYLKGKKRDADNKQNRNTFSVYQTIGLPLTAEIYWNFGKHFGFGLQVITIFSPEQIIFGIGWTKKIGEFSRTEL